MTADIQKRECPDIYIYIDTPALSGIPECSAPFSTPNRGAGKKSKGRTASFWRLLSMVTAGATSWLSLENGISTTNSWEFFASKNRDRKPSDVDMALWKNVSCQFWTSIASQDHFQDYVLVGVGFKHPIVSWGLVSWCLCSWPFGEFCVDSCLVANLDDKNWISLFALCPNKHACIQLCT